ncbi:PAS domain S-box protein [Herbaspirillum sp. HC18]|nr:PAS domain S-box protein [Herbaspirillum sp. HC18]
MDKDIQAYVESLTKKITRLKKELACSRQAEAALRSSEMRYRAIFDDATVGLALLSDNGNFIDANRPFCSALGYDRKELLQHRFFDISHPDDRAADEAVPKKLLSGEMHSLSWERRCVRKDGTVVWAKLSLSVTRPTKEVAPYFLASFENISERKALQESLRGIAANMAKTEAMSLGGTWEWDIENDLAMASPEAYQMLGLPANPAGADLAFFMARVHPEDRQKITEAIRTAITGEKRYGTECRVCLPDGTERLTLVSGEIYHRDEHGKPRTMIGMVQDITQRKKAEQALKESERRFCELFENAVDGIFIANPDGKYLDANPSARAMLGYSAEALGDMYIADLVPEKDKPRLAEARTYFLKDSEHAQVAEWELKRSDGTYLPVEISARILPDGRWMAIMRDISERKRTQRELERYAAEVQDLYDNAPCGYHSVDRCGAFVQVNKTELNWLGYSAAELIGTQAIDLMTEKSQRLFKQAFPRFLSTGQARDLEYEFVRKDGSVLPVLLNASAVRDGQGNVVMSRSTIFDMTELVETQKKLKQAAAVFEHTNDAIIITDADGCIAAVNNAFTRITGYQPEEVLGQNPRLLKSGRQNDEFYQVLWSTLEQTGTWQGELWDRRKSGELFPTWQTISVVKDDSGKITDYISVFSDITAIKQSEEKLKRLAYHDALTGLPNRLLFADRLAQALAHGKRYRTRCALLLLDLDRFKLINDTLGHAAGDQLLQIIADRLQAAVREEDTVARLGGDEFAIVLARLDHTDDAALLARKLTQLVANPIQLTGHALTVSTSIGIGIYPDDGEDAETLSKSADIAMYGAKEKGRNAYEFYTREMTRAATETLMIDRGLRNALKSNELFLHYQPQVSLSTGRIVGLEALIRWDNPVLGPQSPLKFISVAEETDLIESIGDWVFDTACVQLERWRSQGVPPVRLGINFSARQIARPHLVENIRKRLLECHSFNGFGLDIEVTETALQTDPDTIEALKELKALGLRIVIDDFGTGYSSLNSLKHLPVDILKIDRSFIHGIPRDADNKAIASAIIAMGHSLGMSIVAEGVETPDQLRFVMDQRCDDVQGFLFYPPLAADRCEPFLRSGVPIDLLQRCGMAAAQTSAAPARS